VIRENETGACFESGQVESLRRGWKIQDTPLEQLADMGAAGRRWVAEDFTVASIARESCRFNRGSECR